MAADWGTACRAPLGPHQGLHQSQGHSVTFPRLPDSRWDSCWPWRSEACREGRMEVIRTLLSLQLGTARSYRLAPFSWKQKRVLLRLSAVTAHAAAAGNPDNMTHLYWKPEMSDVACQLGWHHRAMRQSVVIVSLPRDQISRCSKLHAAWCKTELSAVNSNIIEFINTSLLGLFSHCGCHFPRPKSMAFVYGAFSYWLGPYSFWQQELIVNCKHRFV